MQYNGSSSNIQLTGSSVILIEIGIISFNVILCINPKYDYFAKGFLFIKKSRLNYCSIYLKKDIRPALVSNSKSFLQYLQFEKCITPAYPTL